MADSQYLFVYGTLRRDPAGAAHPILTAAECLGPASLSGLLYQLAEYPAAVFAADCDARVHGELYRLPAAEALLARLDAYEECTADFSEPHEYRRRQLPVCLTAGGEYPAWVYEYNRPTTGLPLIAGGDYGPSSVRLARGTPET